VIKVNAADPCPCVVVVGARKPTGCCGKVNMDIFLKVSAKGMNGKKHSRAKSFLVCPIVDDGCCNTGNAVHKIPV